MGEEKKKIEPLSPFLLITTVALQYLSFLTMAFMRQTTSHGHIMAEAYSCFQKYVRRGDVDGALYWGAQIGTTYPNALKKRLLQHALEDVCHPGYALDLLGAVKKPTFEGLVPWIVALCRLRKSRAAAWMNRVAVQYVGDPGGAPSALLMSAARALVLHRDAKLEDLRATFGADALRLYKELNNEVLIFHCLLLVRHGVVAPDAYVVAGTCNADLETVRVVPDFALDKHTARGKRLGRGYAHFLETMVVAPRLHEGPDPYEAEARALYTDGKEQRVRHILASSLPTMPMARTDPFDGATEVVQAQLLTGAHKPRVWHAVRDGVYIVIKGPVSTKERDACLAMEDLKTRLRLPRTGLHVEGEYLVMNSVVAHTNLATHVASSKLEKEVRVLTGAGVPVWKPDFLTNPQLVFRLFVSLLLRKIAGANDTCARNFLVDDGRVYSIDDAALGTTTPYMWKKPLSADSAKAHAEALARVWPRVARRMAKWRVALAENPFALSMLEAHSTPAGWKWN